MTEKSDIKNELRRKIKRNLSAPSDAGSQYILNKLKLQIIKIAPAKIFTFIEMEHELPISKIFKYLLGKEISLFVPYFENEKWMIAEINKKTKFILNKFKIKQPLTPGKKYNFLNEIDLNKNDIAIVPGLAFSKKMERLGFGKGIYDSYLSDTECMKIGVCLENQIHEKLPQDEHDIRMDMIITEEKVYSQPNG